MKDSTDRLQPWMRGPLELIRHANGHLIEGGDTDRRLALIGFDNAIEVGIDVFIQLHPKLRNGFAISREASERARQNYHSKIEFLDKYIDNSLTEVRLPIESIVWYHQLRNALYHSGNGMVPEIHVLQGSRDAAIQVFKALFNVDISVMLKDVQSKDGYSRSDAYTYTDNDQMEFLRTFIGFEKALRSFLSEHHHNSSDSLRSVADMWRFYAGKYGGEGEIDRVVMRAIEVRNSIAHGQRLNSSEDIVAIVVSLMDLIASLDDRT